MGAITDTDCNRIEFELRAELTELIARERGLDRGNRLYPSCREEAIRLMGEYRHRGPFAPTTEIEQALLRMIENEAARRLYREEVAAMRAKQVTEVLAQTPEPDPTTVKLVLRDEASGRAFRVTLPVEWIESRWE